MYYDDLAYVLYNLIFHKGYDIVVVVVVVVVAVAVAVVVIVVVA